MERRGAEESALLGAVSGKEHLVTPCLAVRESGAVSGGDRLVASPAGCLRCLGAFHPLPAVIGSFGGRHLVVSSIMHHLVLFSGHNVMLGTFALFLGAVFGGNRLLASPENAAVRCASVASSHLWMRWDAEGSALLGAVSGEEHLVTPCLAVDESGGVSGGDRLGASLHIERRDAKESALLGAVSGKRHLVTSHLTVKESGAVSGGNHLVASPAEVAEPQESI